MAARRHVGCLAAQVTAAALFVALSAWLWFGLDCIPVDYMGMTECDPLPTGTRIVLTLLAAPLALVLGAALGGVVTRLCGGPAPKVHR